VISSPKGFSSSRPIKAIPRIIYAAAVTLASF
jgi:hypothetical protein